MGYVSTPKQTDVYDALADKTRRAILERLAKGFMTAGNIAKMFDISRPAVSRHLRVLTDAALVKQTRMGRLQVYRLRHQPIRVAERWLASLTRSKR